LLKIYKNLYKNLYKNYTKTIQKFISIFKKNIFIYYIMPLGFPQNASVKSLTVAGKTTLAGGLTIASTTSGFVVPRLSTAQQNALPAVEGTLIYNLETDNFVGYANGGWRILNNA